jgi:hypothetical protein
MAMTPKQRIIIASASIVVCVAAFIGGYWYMENRCVSESTENSDMWTSQVAFQDGRTGIFIGSPSITRAPDGALVASHDFFGPNAPKNPHGEDFLTAIYRSTDNGLSWERVTLVHQCYWSNLFTHRGVIYLLGVSAHNESIAIHRSDDSGYTWTHPTSDSTGLLFVGGVGRTMPNYHCAPMPMVIHKGRIWRAFEDDGPKTGFASGFNALVISVPVDADLLNAKNWRMSIKLAYDQDTDPAAYGAPATVAHPLFRPGKPGWLEGNVVVGPDGQLYDMLRLNAFPVLNQAALVKVTDDGRRMEFDPKTGFVQMSGGNAKFVVRRDSRLSGVKGSGLYWALVNDMEPGPPVIYRNRLSLVSSPDLRHWTKQKTLMVDRLEKPDVSPDKTGFQYVDWIFDGDDIIYLSRTSYDGAHRWHDANRITFDRIADFRSLVKER